MSSHFNPANTAWQSLAVHLADHGMLGDLKKRGQKSVRQQAIVDPAHQLSWKRKTGSWVLEILTGVTYLWVREREREKKEGALFKGVQFENSFFLRFHGVLWKHTQVWRSHCVAHQAQGTQKKQALLATCFSHFQHFHSQQTSTACPLYTGRTRVMLLESPYCKTLSH